MHSLPHVRAALDALRSIVRALRLTASNAEKQLHLSAAQLFVLQRMSDGRPRSIVELARETLTDPSSVSVVVSRLVTRKLVSRRPSKDDARRAELALTAAGRKLLDRAPEAAQAKLVRAIAALSLGRGKALASGLSEVAQAIGATDPTLFFEERRVRPPQSRAGRGRR